MNRRPTFAELLPALSTLTWTEGPYAVPCLKDQDFERRAFYANAGEWRLELCAEWLTATHGEYFTVFADGPVELFFRDVAATIDGDTGPDWSALLELAP